MQDFAPPISPSLDGFDFDVSNPLHFPLHPINVDSSAWPAEDGFGFSHPGGEAHADCLGLLPQLSGQDLWQEHVHSDQVSGQDSWLFADDAANFEPELSYDVGMMLKTIEDMYDKEQRQSVENSPERLRDDDDEDEYIPTSLKSACLPHKMDISDTSSPSSPPPSNSPFKSSCNDYTGWTSRSHLDSSNDMEDIPMPPTTPGRVKKAKKSKKKKKTKKLSYYANRPKKTVGKRQYSKANDGKPRHKPCKKVPGWHGVFSRTALNGTKKYFTLVTINGKKVYQGSFDTKEECGYEYDKLIIKHRGANAKLNFPERFPDLH